MSFARKSVLALFGQCAVVILNLSATVLLARKLGHDLGQFDLFRNTASMTVAIAALGIGNANLFVLNARRAPLAEMLGNSLILIAILGAGLLVLVPTLLLGFPRYFGAVTPMVAGVFACGVVGLLGSALIRPLVVARLEIRCMVLADLATPFVLFAGTLLFINFGHFRASVAISLLGAGAITSAGIVSTYLFSLSHWRLRANCALFCETLHHGVRFFASNALQLMIGASIVAILRFFTKDDPGFGPVALYSRAVALSGLSLVFPVAIGPMLFAKWAGMAPQERHEQIELVIRITFWYLVITSAVLLLLGGLLLRVLYGPIFVAAKPTLIVVVAANAMFAVYNVYLNLFASDGRIGVVGWIHGGGLIIGSLVSWLLIPNLGAVGAAAGLCSAYLFCCICGVALGSWSYGIDPRRCLVPRTSDLAALWVRLRS